MNLEEKTKILVDYIRSLNDFEIVKEIDGNYDHMGATITDAMLQAGTTYETVVRPRVQRIQEQYPEARTISEFIKIIDEVGIYKILQWNDEEKPKRILGVVNFFKKENIETETDLKQWLQEINNIEKLKRLRGIGNKTADYFKILVGIQTSAVDRHLDTFLSEAKIKVNGYIEEHQLINKAADQMGVNRAYLDHSIWKYMSKNLNH
ncbi:MAG: hypothetical protein HS132_17955 [Planctomycetia bacterium]|nr:hypothetical protein [Planctomycetia bacterium]